MKHPDLDSSYILCADIIVTQDDHRRVLFNHGLRVSHGIISDIRPSEQLITENQNQLPVHHLGKKILLPGLINAHTHLAMNLLRGIADDLPLMTWLQDHIWPTEGQWVDEAFITDGLHCAFAELIRGGVTCVNDMYFFPEITAKVATKSGIRATIGLLMIDFPTPWGSGPEEYITKSGPLIEQYKTHDLINLAWAPHAPYTVSPQHLRTIAKLSKTHQLPVHIHLHETADEIEQHLEKHQQRPLSHLAELGLLNERLLGVHYTQSSDTEIQQLAAAGASIIHCPESNMKLASGICPSHTLTTSGVNVALGTDGAASNNDLDMFGEMRSASMLAKVSTLDATALPAQTTLDLATRNGAKALGLLDKIGSLECGKQADMIALDIDNPEALPLYDPISHIVFAAHRSQVTHSWVKGKPLMTNTQLHTLDPKAITEKARHWQQKIQKRES